MYIQASLKVLPKAASREESYKLVDEALLLISKSGFLYEVGTSETTVEGELDDVLELVSKLHKLYFEQNVEFSFFLNSEYNIQNFYIEDKHENIEKIIN